VVVRIILDGVEQEMAFLTNNMTWSALTIAELYRCRWEIEKFFRQIKQTLQLGDFLGNNENAVKVANLDGALAVRPLALHGRISVSGAARLLGSGPSVVQ